MSKKKVAFICVHNSCRSQIAEALGKHLASDVFESYSAGTETKPQINQDAVRIMKELYGIDMEKTQYSKLISDIPAPDIAISMGCNVGCPFIGRAFDDNWGLEDPTGSEDQVFVEIIREIEKRILQLKQSLISRIQLVSATAGFGSACFDCSLAISSSHTSLGVLYPRSFMGVSLISPTIASSSSCVRSSKLVPLGR